MKMPTCVGIGNFDGVHLGHRKLIQQLIDYAKAHKLSPCVVTFEPHPASILRPGKPVYRLTLKEEKSRLLKALGIEHVEVVPFTLELAAQSAQDFFDTLLKDKLKAQAVFVGADFTFGKNREGTSQVLKKMGDAAKTHVEVVSFLTQQEIKISSSVIRQQILEGNFNEVNAALGRTYSIEGEVVHGEGRGKKLGIPTANLKWDPIKAVPNQGVYATWAKVENLKHPSVTNIGIRPTFKSEMGKAIEVHLLGTSQNLYGKKMEIELVQKLRDEKKFNGIEDLKNQIQKDCELAAQVLR